MKALIKRIRHSLPIRLMLVFLVVCLCVIALLAATLMQGFGSQWEHGIKPHLNQYLSYVNADIGNPPNFARAEELAKRLPINIYIDGPEQHYSSTGSSLNMSELEFRRERERWHTQKGRKNRLEQDNPDLSFGELNDRTVLRNKLGQYTVYYEVLHDDSRKHQSGFIWRALAWLLVILALSYWLLLRMLKPVQDIKIGVQRMGNGELEHRLPKRADNDLGELSESINHMARDIQSMLDAKRQLLLALSHELRSPITRAKVAVQMLEPSATQRSIDDDLSEMKNLITEILEAEHISGRHAALRRSKLDPATLVHGVVHEFGTTVQLQLTEALPECGLDETRIKLLLRNLIKNALTHSSNASRPPVVSAQIKNNYLELSVQDFGDGIAREHLAHITEPFYRADPSRSRATGGFGLGLHLCKLIAEAHGGHLKINSELGSGCSVTAALAIV